MGTLKETLSELKSRVKPYLSIKPEMHQGTFSNTIKAIEYGFAKPKTTESFLNKFGYVKDGENWVKVKEIISMQMDEVSLLLDGTHGIGASNVKYK